MENEAKSNRALLALPLGEKGSGRQRYAAAMYLFQAGELDALTLEAYRICAKLDNDDPLEVLREWKTADARDLSGSGSHEIDV